MASSSATIDYNGPSRLPGPEEILLNLDNTPVNQLSLDQIRLLVNSAAAILSGAAKETRMLIEPRPRESYDGYYVSLMRELAENAHDADEQAEIWRLLRYEPGLRGPEHDDVRMDEGDEDAQHFDTPPAAPSSLLGKAKAGLGKLAEERELAATLIERAVVNMGDFLGQETSGDAPETSE